ncbi:MAG: response regulator [bacterium]|nr:response regulator [bacterium]
MSEKTRIVLIDDHRVLIDGLAMCLNKINLFDVCGLAQSVQEGMNAVEAHKPDVVIVDLSLKDGSGLTLIKDIHARFPSIKLIALSMLDENIYAERVIRAGGRGYVMKGESLDHVVDAIQQVSKGGIYASEEIREKVMLRLLSSGSGEQAGVERLSDRELEVYQWIQQGFRPKDIAEKLSVSVRTIETHCNRIRDKLNLKNMKELAQYAIQNPLGNS